MATRDSKKRPSAQKTDRPAVGKTSRKQAETAGRRAPSAPGGKRKPGTGDGKSPVPPRVAIGEIYRLLFEEGSDAILLVDNETGRILEANRAAVELYGYPVEKLCAMRNVDLSAEPEEMRTVTTSNPPDPDRVVRIPLRRHRNSRGEVFPVEITERSFIHQGRPVHLTALREIRERLSAETALRESEEKFRSLFQCAVEGIQLHDLEGRIVDVNEMACRQSGYTREELLQRNVFDDLVPPPDGAGLTKEEILRLWHRWNSGERHKYVGVHRHKDGTTYPVEISTGVVRIGGKNLALAIVQDIRERKLAEDRWRFHSEEIAVLNELAGEVGRSLTIESVMESALRGMAQSARSDLAFFFIRREGALILSGVHPAAAAARLQRIPEHKVGECMCGLAVAKGKPLYSRDIFADPRCTWDECKRAGFRSFAALPLLDGKEAIGVVGLAADTERDFAGQAEFLEAMAGTVAAGLKNARLYNEATETRNALRESEARLAMALDGTLAGLWDWNVETGAVYINENWARIVGRTLGELAPVSIDIWERLCHPDDLIRSNEVLERHFRGETALYECECRMRHKDGRWIWVLDRGRVMERDAAGRPVRMVGTHIDITERKRLEAEREQTLAALRNSEQLLAEAQRVAGLGTWELIVDQNTVHWSDEERQIFGVPDGSSDRSLEEVLSFIAPDDRTAVQDRIRQALSGKIPYEFESRIIRPDGSHRFIHTKADVRRDSEGRAVRVLGTTLDITERKLTEERLKASEARLQSIFRAAPIGIGLVIDRMLVQVNDRFCEMTGWAREELSGQSARRLYPSDAEYEFVGREKYAQIARRGTGTVEARWKRKDETVIDVLLSSTPLDPENLALGVTFTALDITDRIRAEEALRVSEERYRMISQVAADYIFRLRISPEGGVTMDYVSENFTQITGRTLEEVRDTFSWKEIFHPDDLAYAMQTLQSILTTGEPATLEVRSIIRSRNRWISILANPQKDIATGRVAAIIGAIKDVTQRKEAEQALQESEQRYRALVEQSLTGISMIQDGRFLYVNSRMAEMYNYSVEEMLGMSPLEFTHPADRDRIAGLIERRLAGELTDAHYLFRGVRKDGREIEVELYGRTILHNGRPATMSTLIDVTEQRRAERELAETKTLLEAAIQQTPIPLVLVSAPDKVVRIYNTACAEYLGIQNEPSAIGQPVYSIPQTWKDFDAQGAPVPMKDMPLGLALQGVATRNVEYRTIRSDGSERWNITSGAPIHNAAGDLIAGFVAFPDITDRKKAEAVVRTLNAELEQRVHERTAQMEVANRELESFAYSVSHDLRAPLRAIDGYARILLEDHGGRLDGEGRQLIGVICENARRMGALIDDLLALSRMSRMEMQRTRVDMQAVAADVFRELTTPEERARINFSIEPLPEVRGDHTLLRQVWTNLISNAIKFSARQERPCLSVCAKVEPSEIQFTVRDNGVGFQPGYAGKLFKPFERLHSSKEFEGTGVGLAIVRRLVERHGGRVWAEGEPGKGAAFSFALPRSE